MRLKRPPSGRTLDPPLMGAGVPGRRKGYRLVGRCSFFSKSFAELQDCFKCAPWGRTVLPSRMGAAVPCPHFLSTVMNQRGRMLPRGPQLPSGMSQVPVASSPTKDAKIHTQPLASSPINGSVMQLQGSVGMSARSSAISTSLQHEACPLCRSETAFMSGPVSPTSPSRFTGFSCGSSSSQIERFSVHPT